MEFRFILNDSETSYMIDEILHHDIDLDGDTLTFPSEGPNGKPVTNIGFRDWSSVSEFNYIKKIIVPDTVTAIKSCGFRRFGKLEYVKLSDKMKTFNVYNHLNSDIYRSLTTLIVPKSIKKINEDYYMTQNKKTNSTHAHINLFIGNDELRSYYNTHYGENNNYKINVFSNNAGDIENAERIIDIKKWVALE